MENDQIIELIKTAIPLPISFLLGAMGGVLIVYSMSRIIRGVKGKKTFFTQIVGCICMLGFMPIMASFLT
jgi:hypothetical protein